MKLANAITMAQSGKPMLAAQYSARIYRDYGWNPLPSSRTERHPALNYSKYWQKPIEPWVIDRWPSFNVANIQVMCGVRWNLAVIDLDGELAVDAWRTQTIYQQVPETWTVKTGGGWWHLYFSIPEGIETLPKATLWDLGEHHSKIELLGDGALVIAPPSRHWRTGKLYEWMHRPQVESPAELPAWILQRAEQSRIKPVLPKPQPLPMVPRSIQGGSYAFRDVIRAVPDKAALASFWGLRFSGRSSGSDWLECHAIDRDDSRPSAGFSPVTGYYSEPFVRKLDLFDLGVALGRYATWQDCCNDLGRQYIGESNKRG